MSKLCSACKRDLPFSAFHKDAAGPDGFVAKCKECRASQWIPKKQRKAQRDSTISLAAGPNITAFNASKCLTPGMYSVECHCAYCARVTRERGRTPSSRPTIEVVGEHVKPVVQPHVITVQETITQVEEHRLKRRVRDLESENAKLVAQLSDGGEYAEVVAEVLARQHEAPPISIAPRERTSNLAEATPLVLASDWHIEEEVTPEQVAGRNRYNLDISARRMERFFEATRWAINHQRQVPFKIRDMIGWWGGDFITNFLHPDNVESNLLHPSEAIFTAQKSIISGIDYWLEDPEIETFTFPCCDGNHGRLTKKMQSATRTQNSLEVLLYAQLAYHYRNEPRVRFILPTSSFTFLDDVYGRTIRFLHGDVFRYSGGVGGITIPLMKALAKWETVKRADLTAMGHWHQRINLPNLMVNGSLIGYNSFAMDISAAFEPPVQSLRMLEPRRWCSSDVPLWVSERNDDNMNKE